MIWPTIRGKIKAVYAGFFVRLYVLRGGCVHPPLIPQCSFFFKERKSRVNAVLNGFGDLIPGDLIEDVG